MAEKGNFLCGVAYENGDKLRVYGAGATRTDDGIKLLTRTVPFSQLRALPEGEHRFEEGVWPWFVAVMVKADTPQ